MYNKSKDPRDHIETYKAHMTLERALGKIMCQAFPLTIKGPAKRWFGSLLLD
jgi:hypothetical protein